MSFQYNVVLPRPRLRGLSKRSLVVLLTLLSGCSGGGGGGDDTGGATAGATLQRTSSTGIRLIHGTIDESPLEMQVDGVTVQSAGFGDETFYAKVSPGPHRVALVRKNSPTEVVYEQTLTVLEKTEYSLILSGESRVDTFNASLTADPIARGEKGTGRVSVVNALGGRDGIRVTCGSESSEAITEGKRSNFIEVGSSPVECVIATDDGVVIARQTVLPVETGEHTLAVMGSQSLGARFVKSFRDLD